VPARWHPDKPRNVFSHSQRGTPKTIRIASGTISLTPARRSEKQSKARCEGGRTREDRPLSRSADIPESASSPPLERARDDRKKNEKNLRSTRAERRDSEKKRRGIGCSRRES